MIKGKGMMWWYSNHIMPIQGIMEGITYYKEKYGKTANCIHISMAQSLTSLSTIVIQGVSIVPDTSILKNCVWIGEE